MKISRPLAAAVFAPAPRRVRQLAVRGVARRDGCHDALLLLHERLCQRCEGSSHGLGHTRGYSSHVCAGVFDIFLTSPYFVDCTGFQLCTRCYGDRNYDKLDLLHDDYAPGQVRRWDDYSDHTVALKPVVCVPGEEDGDEHEPWTVEDWVPIRPRKRPRKEKTYPFVPMFELEKDRHNRLRFSITFHQKHYMLVH